MVTMVMMTMMTTTTSFSRLHQVTKLSKKKNADVTYVYRSAFSLDDLAVYIFETPCEFSRVQYPWAHPEGEELCVFKPPLHFQFFFLIMCVYKKHRK